jgi:DNA modification methylase
MSKSKTSSPAVDRGLEVERVEVSTLLNDPANVRKHNERNLESIKASLARFGQQKPIVVGRDGVVIAGNGTLAAARSLGWSTIDIVRSHLTGAEATAYAIADNRTAELAEWDEDALAQQLAALQIEDEELLAATGFDEKELEAMSGPAEVEEDEVPEPPADPITKPGDLWILGEHRLLCGDSTKADDVARLMDGAVWRLCVTSPPYNQKLDSFKPSGMHTETKWVKNVQHGSYFDSKPESEYQSEQIAAIKVWAKQASVDASVFYNHKNRYREKQVVSPWLWLSQTGMKVRQEIIWKREGSVTQNARMFMPCDERIFWLYLGDDFYFDDSTEHKTWSSVWQINSHKDREESMHGCAFPMELASRPILACSESGDVVFEPYCGSGTTLIAAEQLGRKCYGMEISPAYCDVIVKRWETLTGKKAERGA